MIYPRRVSTTTFACGRRTTYMNAYRLTRHAARGMHACARLTTLLYTTCNREHGASRWAWGGATNLRPLPEGAEEGRAARVQCRPGWAGPRLVRYGPVRQKTQTFVFYIVRYMQPNKTLSHSTWMAAAATGTANKKALRVTIPRRRAEPLDTLEDTLERVALYCTMVYGPARRHQHHLFTLHRSNNASFATPSVDDDGAGEQRDSLCSARARTHL